MFVQAGFLIVFDNKDKPILVPAMSLSTDYVRVISAKAVALGGWCYDLSNILNQWGTCPVYNNYIFKSGHYCYTGIEIMKNGFTHSNGFLSC